MTDNIPTDYLLTKLTELTELQKLTNYSPIIKLLPIVVEP